MIITKTAHLLLHTLSHIQGQLSQGPIKLSIYSTPEHHSNFVAQFFVIVRMEIVEMLTIKYDKLPGIMVQKIQYLKKRLLNYFCKETVNKIELCLTR